MKISADLNIYNRSKASILKNIKVNSDVKISESTDDDSVEISTEAKAESEKKEVHTKMETGDSGGTKESSDEKVSTLDLIIEKLKGQIENVKKQIEKMGKAETKSEEQVKKALNEQLAKLNAALMDAINKKLEKIQE